MKVGEVSFEHLSSARRDAYAAGNPPVFETGERIPVRLTETDCTRDGVSYVKTTGVALMLVGDREGTVTVDGSEVYLERSDRYEEGN